MITGDKHQNSVRNVAESYTDLAGPPVATEFVGTSISSEGDTPPRTTHGGDPSTRTSCSRTSSAATCASRSTRRRWRSDFRVVETVRRRENVPASTLESWIVENGQPGAVPATSQPPDPVQSVSI